MRFIFDGTNILKGQLMKQLPQELLNSAGGLGPKGQSLRGTTDWLSDWLGDYLRDSSCDSLVNLAHLRCRDEYWPKIVFTLVQQFFRKVYWILYRFPQVTHCTVVFDRVPDSWVSTRPILAKHLSWRKFLYPGYKAGRRSKFAAAMTSEQHRKLEDLVAVTAGVLHYALPVVGVSVLVPAPGRSSLFLPEGDDLVALAVAAGKAKGLNQVVCSSDKDFWCLATRRRAKTSVGLYSPFPTVPRGKKGLFKGRDLLYRVAYLDSFAPPARLTGKQLDAVQQSRPLCDKLSRTDLQHAAQAWLLKAILGDPSDGLDSTGKGLGPVGARKWLTMTEWNSPEKAQELHSGVTTVISTFIQALWQQGLTVAELPAGGQKSACRVVAGTRRLPPLADVLISGHSNGIGKYGSLWGKILQGGFQPKMMVLSEACKNLVQDLDKAFQTPSGKSWRRPDMETLLWNLVLGNLYPEAIPQDAVRFRCAWAPGSDCGAAGVETALVQQGLAIFDHEDLGEGASLNGVTAEYLTSVFGNSEKFLNRMLLGDSGPSSGTSYSTLANRLGPFRELWRQAFYAGLAAVHKDVR